MTGPEHYKEAERLLGVVSDIDKGVMDHAQKLGITLAERAAMAGPAANLIGAAQVHAMLALTAATVGLDAIEGPNGGSATGRTAEDAKAWDDVIGGADDAAH